MEAVLNSPHVNFCDILFCFLISCAQHLESFTQERSFNPSPLNQFVFKTIGVDDCFYMNKVKVCVE